MKLRQAALHPLLVKTNDPDDNLVDADEESGLSLADLKAQFTGDSDSFQSKAYQNFLQAQKDGALPECPICMDEASRVGCVCEVLMLTNLGLHLITEQMESPVLLPCGHSGCKQCMIDCINQRLDAGEKGCCPTCQVRPSQESYRGLLASPD
jgi:hypothetical protein